ncbi:MAG: transposase [Nocardioidaceae bacterium]|nr:transposase [Nocardioidaceae bacterium]
MPQKRRKFNPQFKAEAGRWCWRLTSRVAVVARDLAINEGTLGNWVNAWRREHPEPDPELTPTERARVADLMRELGLRAVQPRAYRRTTIPGQGQPATPDVIDRDFAPGAQGGEPGTRLVGTHDLRTEQRRRLT